MRISYDASVDAAYIYLVNESERFGHGFTYCCDPQEVDGQVHLDFDAAGRLIGIEILQASKKLPLSLLKTNETNGVTNETVDSITDRVRPYTNR